MSQAAAWLCDKQDTQNNTNMIAVHPPWPPLQAMELGRDDGRIASQCNEQISIDTDWSTKAPGHDVIARNPSKTHPDIDTDR